MTKTLLIISGGVEAADAVKRAKEMGLDVVVSDINPEAPGFAIADSPNHGSPNLSAMAKNVAAKIPQRIEPRIRRACKPAVTKRPKKKTMVSGDAN